MLVSDKLNKFTSNTFVFIVWVVGLSRQIYALHSFTHRIKSDLKQVGKVHFNAMVHKMAMGFTGEGHQALITMNCRMRISGRETKNNNNTNNLSPRKEGLRCERY
ncbi:hypothetical protein F4703DRAFT_1830317 [Phycomyces blakesleeanus]